jgi:avirulence protein
MPKGHLPGRWIHPAGIRVEPLLRHAETLFDRAVDRDASPSEVIRAAAEMHWWLAHAMPFQRGSAAITDALVKAIYLSHGISFSPYRVGIQPDIAAFTLRLDDFLAVYPRFFDLTFDPRTMRDLSWQKRRANLSDDEKFSPIANLGKPRIQ